MKSVNNSSAKALRVQADHISFPGERLAKAAKQSFNRYANGNESIFGHVSTSFGLPQGDDIEVQSGPNFLSDLPKYL